MDRSNVITLVSETYKKNSKGVMKKTTKKREIFCQVNSITRNEFFDAGRNGLNPEFMFLVFFDDYEGEKTLIYDGNQYGIYRTYRGRGDTLELYAERKGGTNESDG